MGSTEYLGWGARSTCGGGTIRATVPGMSKSSYQEDGESSYQEDGESSY